MLRIVAERLQHEEIERALERVRLLGPAPQHTER
jgi:hypothetical protein